MRCPKCQFENANAIDFFGKCGAKLERFCPQCNFDNPSGYEFCGKCYDKLSLPAEQKQRELSFDEKLNNLQKYLTKGPTENILFQWNRIKGEFKQVTVIFCDLDGFTSLSKKIDPDKANTFVDQVFEILTNNVHDYEGTVNEMIDDMGLWPCLERSLPWKMSHRNPFDQAWPSTGKWPD